MEIRLADTTPAALWGNPPGAVSTQADAARQHTRGCKPAGRDGCLPAAAAGLAPRTGSNASEEEREAGGDGRALRPRAKLLNRRASEAPPGAALPAPLGGPAGCTGFPPSGSGRR